ncbi:MAG: DUF4907 domain-containing protein [Bacteroidales bacterium]
MMESANNRATRFLLVIASLLVGLIFLSGCKQQAKDSRKNGRQENRMKVEEEQPYPDDVKARVFQNADSTWGFAIYLNGRLYINQQVMPGVESIKGFVNRKQAEKVADVVTRKIRMHKLPAGVTGRELDSLGITNTTKKK